VGASASARGSLALATSSAPGEGPFLSLSEKRLDKQIQLIEEEECPRKYWGKMIFRKPYPHRELKKESVLGVKGTQRTLLH